MEKLSLLWISINPDPVCFTIPFLGHNIAWYGIIFSLAFFTGYKIFIWMWKRHALQQVAIPKEYKNQKPPSSFSLSKERSSLYNFYKERIKEESKRKTLFTYLYLEQIYTKTMPSISKQATSFADSALLYIITATIVGARLGHIIFYQHLTEYLKNPLMILKTWEGGLASHGGIIAILVAALLFVRKHKHTNFLTFMDMISVPTMFVCAWIRIGNFINQEILGAASNAPWAILFLSPADGGAVVPRHPMQLYEFLLYMGVSITLFVIWRKNTYKTFTGLYTGLALSISFGGRFFLEFLKVPQAARDTSSFLQTGQMLSIPMVAFGLYLCWKAFTKKEGLDKKVSEH